jgi:acyl-CoA thioester hydrolase
MKPPAWRQDPDVYPHVFELQPRYHDEDALRHINNIAVAAYYDEARSRFSRQVFAQAGIEKTTRIVTADSRVTYLAEVFYPDMVEVRTGILRIGGASYDLGQALFQKGRCVGVAMTTFVQASSEGASPLSDSLRAALEAAMVRQPT